MKPTNPNFETTLNQYIASCQALVEKVSSDKLILNMGSRYAKIVRKTDSQELVYSFVDKSNGDIYRPATWRQPAKGVRGNIFSADLGMSCMSASGVAYKTRVKKSDNEPQMEVSNQSASIAG